MLQELLSIVLPVFGCALVGFIWKRVKPELDEETLSELTVYIGSPCLIFHALVTAESSPEALRSMGLYALIGISSTIALSAVFLRMARIEASSFLGPLSFGNTGNLGIPICFFAFGNEGKALGIAYFGVSFLMNSVVGELLFSGHFALKRVLRSPLVYAAILSVIVVGFELEVPTTVLRTTELLGGLAIPLMLIALGASLARLADVKMQKSIALAGMRFVLGLIPALALAAFFELDHRATGVLLLQSTTPVGVFNYVLARHYAREPDQVAGLIFASTLLAILTIPAMLIVLLG